jgi:hypothetical protein
MRLRSGCRGIDNRRWHQMTENLPFIWRKYYRNETPSAEKVLLEAAHEQARQYLSRAVAAAWRSTLRL